MSNFQTNNELYGSYYRKSLTMSIDLLLLIFLFRFSKTNHNFHFKISEVSLKKILKINRLPP